MATTSSEPTAFDVASPILQRLDVGFSGLCLEAYNIARGDILRVFPFISIRDELPDNYMRSFGSRPYCPLTTLGEFDENTFRESFAQLPDEVANRTVAHISHPWADSMDMPDVEMNAPLGKAFDLELRVVQDYIRVVESVCTEIDFLRHLFYDRKTINLLQDPIPPRPSVHIVISTEDITQRLRSALSQFTGTNGFINFKPLRGNLRGHYIGFNSQSKDPYSHFINFCELVQQNYELYRLNTVADAIFEPIRFLLDIFSNISGELSERQRFSLSAYCVCHLTDYIAQNVGSISSLGVSDHRSMDIAYALGRIEPSLSGVGQLTLETKDLDVTRAYQRLRVNVNRLTAYCTGLSTSVEYTIDGDSQPKYLVREGHNEGFSPAVADALGKLQGIDFTEVRGLIDKGFATNGYAAGIRAIDILDSRLA